MWTSINKKITALTLSTCLLATLAAAPVWADEFSETEAAPESTQAAAVRDIAGPFEYEITDLSRLYVINHRDYTYVQVDSTRVAEAYRLLMEAGNSEPDQVFAQTEGAFFAVLGDGTKYTYTLVPGAVRLDETAYPLDSDDYAALLSVFTETVARKDALVQWLAYMSPDRVTSITYQKDRHTSPQSIPADKVLDAATIIRNIRVKPDSGNAYTKLKTLDKKPGNTVIKLNFNGGITYTVLVDKDSLTIQSSDMTYGITYNLETSKKAIENTFDSFLS